MAELETEVELLKKELHDQRKIHDRLDIAIEKLIFEAEHKIEERRSELLQKIDELHSRITTNTKEIMTTATEQHKQQCDEVRKIREELSTRVGVLEKWRWIIIGGSIIIGFIAQKFMLIGG